MSSNYKLSNIVTLLSYMMTTLVKIKLISDLLNIKNFYHQGVMTVTLK